MRPQDETLDLPQKLKLKTSLSYAYPEAVSPVPTETGYTGQNLETASSYAEVPYGHREPQGLASNGCDFSNTNGGGGSGASSPAPYDQNGYNGNGYAGYSENGSIYSTNTNGNTRNENGSALGGYAGNKRARRRLLPAIPKGEKQCGHVSGSLCRRGRDCRQESWLLSQIPAPNPSGRRPAFSFQCLKPQRSLEDEQLPVPGTYRGTTSPARSRLQVRQFSAPLRERRQRWASAPSALPSALPP